MNYLDGDWGADCASLDKHFGVQRLDPTKRPVCARRRGEELMTSNLCSYLALANTLSLGFKQLQINCFKGTSEEVRRGNPNQIKSNHFFYCHITTKQSKAETVHTAFSFETL